MDGFFKYLTPSKEDREWGISFNVVGKSEIRPNMLFPSPSHPSGYFFTWESGRVLSEYQVNYVTEGKGIIETRRGKYNIEAGSVMLIKPGVWHRYRPVKEEGWTVYCIGITGETVEKMFANPVLKSDHPIIHCGHKESVLDCYDRIFELCQDERPGFQLVSSGIAIRLLGILVAHVKNREFKGKPIDETMERAKYIIRDQLEQPINFEELAASLNLGYSYFRQMFKKHTGFSPGQYHLHLRLQRAKELLLVTELPIKKIALDTGFDSVSYFSRIFKSKMGIPPSRIRDVPED